MSARRPAVEPQELAALPLFDGLPEERIGALLAGSPVEVVAARTLLFDAGAEADAFFILLTGRIKLFTLQEDGRESVVEIILPVSSFAEAAMFASARYPVSAEAIEASEILRVPAGVFLPALRGDPALSRRILASLWRWDARLAQELRSLREVPPLGRLAGYLLSLAATGEAAAEAGPAVVELPVAKAVLAKKLGMEPESLSRVLTRLRQFGVRSSGRAVEIEDVAVLRRLRPQEPVPVGPATVRIDPSEEI